MSTSPRPLAPRVRFFVYALLGILWLWTPYISVPIHWIEVFFHELSHALAAILTGGRVISIELNADGSGLATYSGSAFRPIVTFAGYFGATLFGALLYRIGRPGRGQIGTWLMVLGVPLALLLWGRDLETWLIGAGIVGFILAAKMVIEPRFSGPMFGVIGCAVIFSSFQSVTSLLGASVHSDAQSLAQQLLLPSFVWVGLWIAWTLIVSLWVYRQDLKRA